MANNPTKEQKQDVLPVLLYWLILLSPFLFGLFFPWTSAAVSIVLTAVLLLRLKKRQLYWSPSPVHFAASGLVLFLPLGTVWGTDRGMALVGAVQFLPLPLFVLTLEQLSPEQRETLIPAVWQGACLMVPLALILSRIFPGEGWFLVSGRQAGFFQYPNTYALYLLCGVVTLLFGKVSRFGPIPWLAVLMLGIALSGSRTVFVLLAAVLIIAALCEKQRLRRLQLIGLLAAILLAGFIFVVITGSRTGIGRFLSISLGSSEFLGRLLYAYDALPVILKHPLGIGYTGYQWLQGSFQTGVYTVSHVHNDLLQVLLDAGWIPALMLLCVLGRSFVSPKTGCCRRAMMTVIALHVLVDFDLQFVAVALLLLFAADTEPQASRTIHRTALPTAALLVGLICSLWIGSASLCCYLGRYDQAAVVYPGYTTALVRSISDASEEEENKIAEQILKLNGNVAPAWRVRARSAYREGKLNDYLEAEEQVLRLSKYSLPRYTECFQELRQAYELCLQRGDRSSAELCLKALAAIPQRLKTVETQTSRLGWMIRDLPKLSLPADMLQWLQTHVHS